MTDAPHDTMWRKRFKGMEPEALSASIVALQGKIESAMERLPRPAALEELKPLRRQLEIAERVAGHQEKLAVRDRKRAESKSR